MNSSVPQLALGAVSLLSIYIFAVVAYRLTLHPLAKHPGPWLAKVTELYDTYHSWKGDRHIDQWNCHEIYGPIVRYAPNHVIINTTGALRDIYSGSKNSNVQKAPMYKLLHVPVSSTQSAIDKSVHGRKRRVLSHAFSEQALRSLEVFIVKEVDQWCKLLGDSTNDDDHKTTSSTWSKPKDMAKWANYVTFDVLGNLGFGKSFNMMESDENRRFPDLMLMRTGAFQIVGNSPLLPIWKTIEKFGIDKLISPTTAHATAEFANFARRAMKERVEKSKVDTEKSTITFSDDSHVRKDFFYWLTQATDPVTGEGYTMPEMWAEARLLIGAGSDTSSITMAAAFFYLTRQPHVQAKLQQELRSTFSDVQDIVSGPKLNSCTYLRAVIEECLRMNPPVASDLQREVMPGGIHIDGEYFPAGTIVGTSAYAIHHSESYYEDPFSFKPERWIATATITDDHSSITTTTPVSAESVTAARSAFCPFSLGSRGCIGKAMAYAELSIALGRVFWLYDVRAKEGDRTGEGDPESKEFGRRRKDEYQTRDAFVAARDGPIVEFRARMAGAA